MPLDDDEASPGSVKSAHRTLSILELLTRADSPLTFGEISSALGYPRSSLFGLLNTLQARRWIELDESARTYRLGVRTFEAGNAYGRSLSLLPIAMPHMRRVCHALDETVQIAVLDGRYNVYLGKVEGKSHLRLASEVGRRLEAHATALGKMLLAGLTDEEFARLFDGVELEVFTPNTCATLTALKDELDKTRTRGYAEDNEEYTTGVRCFAVPVPNHMGRTIAALSVSFPTVRFTDAKGEEARALLWKAADGTSATLGYRSNAIAGKSI
ncbi:MAG: IclR family transcriptional regulator [Chloroflexia bacterium]|nr:IclR family transcriptional regulator [Chloroflexia bacterium]